MNTTHKAGFTLIELMVVITIMGIVAMATYIPYSHHQKKVLLKQAAREISQSLSDARSMAINGLNTGSGNLDVGLLFSSGATELIYYTAPFEETLTRSNIETLGKEYQTKPLPAGTSILSVGGNTNNTLFQFEAISGSGSTDPDLGKDAFDIVISYKGATSPVLQKIVTYYPKSYISDY